MGYGLKWRRWIQCCVEHVRFSVLISGSSEGYFKSKKGIRQGDPLSPFLFLIVGEALTAMMKKAQEDGFINGFQVSNTGTKVSHLQFIAKLAWWKRPYPTRAGKIALINSVLSSFPVYFMSLFDMPKFVELKLGRIMKNFLWNDNKGHRKLHLVKWDAVCRRRKN
ncbi:uncharacterized protein LOC113341382 [Papaver somniferum]|uniref:uncharacterized protein LOC113341382 n=1 Tax=Papaver somniferum TaxID=3469 RepID=UPI000E6F5B17|nr:uncharacterized protein LOC113341382 [Papaver somniferum]